MFSKLKEKLKSWTKSLSKKAEESAEEKEEIIEIEEEIYDVVSEGEFITNGTVVRVVAIEGNKITVKRVL